MAEDVRHFTVTFPAGSGSAAVSTFDVSFPPRVVRRIDWRVPHGAMGTMGFVLAMGGVPVLPVYGAFNWVIADGETAYWEPDSYADSGAWQCMGYNTGTNPHAVYLTFHCDLPSRQSGLAAMLPAYELMPAPDLSKAGPPVARMLWHACHPFRWPITGLARAAHGRGPWSGWR